MLKRTKRNTGLERAIGAFAVDTKGARTTIKFSGPWDVPTVTAHEKELYALAADESAAKQVTLDLSSVTRLDTVGAIAVSALQQRLAGGKAEIVGAHDAHTILLDQVVKADSNPLPKPAKLTWVDRVALLGEWTVGIGHEARQLLGFFGELCVVLLSPRPQSAPHSLHIDRQPYAAGRHRCHADRRPARLPDRRGADFHQRRSASEIRRRAFSSSI
jgi:anti-anti-sigma regulatory factor